MPRTQEILNVFTPITLKEMDSVKLLDRIDTKFVFGEALLTALLERLREEYRVLEVNGRRGTDYRTLYYDTTDFRHFQDHHKDSILRSKVRYREYLGSGVVFLEVKRKTGRGRTNKVRLRVEDIPLDMPADHRAFVQKACQVKEAHVPQLWNTFRRITCVHRDRLERLTLDTGLKFERDGKEAILGPACIAELKQQEGDTGSPFSSLMKKMGQRPTGMSKYCVGMWKLVPGMQYEAFMDTFHKLARLQPAALAISQKEPDPGSSGA